MIRKGLPCTCQKRWKPQNGGECQHLSCILSVKRGAVSDILFIYTKHYQAYLDESDIGDQIYQLYPEDAINEFKLMHVNAKHYLEPIRFWHGVQNHGWPTKGYYTLLSLHNFVLDFYIPLARFEFQNVLHALLLMLNAHYFEIRLVVLLKNVL